jgi:hypothetical protein
MKNHAIVMKKTMSETKIAMLLVKMNLLRN